MKCCDLSFNFILFKNKGKESAKSPNVYCLIDYHIIYYLLHLYTQQSK